MKSNCFVEVWSFISVIFLLSLNSEASSRICSKSRAIKAECGQTSTALSFTSRTRKHHRIAGGYDPKPGQFPSFASLRISTGSKKYRCSGVLIDTDVVLTAAHCLDFPNLSIKVGLGTYEPVPFGSWSEANEYLGKHFCKSPKYRSIKNKTGAEYDYGIVKLEKQVQLSEAIQTACLPDQPINGSTQAYTLGVGSAGPDVGYELAQVLPVKKFACDSSHVDQTRTCFRSNDPKYMGVPCNGDSGGPTYATEGNKMVVVGLTSYRIGHARCMKGIIASTVMADVFKQKEHILELIESCKGSRVHHLIDYDDDDEED